MKAVLKYPIHILCTQLFFVAMLLFPFTIMRISRAEYLIGNSNLLSMIDDTGKISMLRWERIWGENQLGPPLIVPSMNGLICGSSLFLLKSQDNLYSLYYPANSKVTFKYPHTPVVSVTSEIETIRVLCEQEYFTHYDKDVVCIKVSCSYPSKSYEPQELVGIINFSLTPPPIKDAPFFEDIRCMRSWSIAFYDNEMSAIVYIRPFKSSRRDLERYKDLVERNQPISRIAKKFEDGIYIALFSQNPSRCLLFSNNKFLEPFSSILTLLSTNDSEDILYALCMSPTLYSSMETSELVVNDFFIYVAFAHNYTELSELVRWVRTKDYHALLEETKDSWDKRFSSSSGNIMAIDWLKLELSTDSTTGAILPQPEKSNEISIAESCVLTSELIRGKMYDRAKSQLFFWSEVAKRARQSGRVAIPNFVYPDGSFASPDYWSDITTNALYLYLCYLVCSSIPSLERKFFNEIWDIIRWAGNQIAIWQMPGELKPSPSFSYPAMIDTVSVNLVLKILIGLKSAQELCKLNFIPTIPEWVQREKEITLWLTNAILNKESLWIYYEPDLLVWKNILQSEHIVWNLPVIYQGNHYTLREVIDSLLITDTDLRN